VATSRKVAAGVQPSNKTESNTSAMRREQTWFRLDASFQYANADVSMIESRGKVEKESMTAIMEAKKIFCKEVETQVCPTTHITRGV
jgi:hypothetical protein